jgi:uncharacterized protein (TIGR02246 family)
MVPKFLLLAALTALSSILVSAQVSAKDEALLKQLVDNMTTAQANYDAAALDKLFTADYIEISPVGEFDPRAKVMTFYTPEEKAKTAGMSVNVEETFRSIRVYGDTAIVISEFAYTMTKDGNNRPGPKIMATVVARKERGSWKIASAQYTGVRPQQAKPQ